jgi:hypothetical protein
MHSQSHFRKSLNLRRNGDILQQSIPRLAETVSSVLRQSGAMCMSRKALTREIVLAAVLDVVMGFALLTGTVYVASLCLAAAGH